MTTIISSSSTTTTTIIMIRHAFGKRDFIHRHLLEVIDRDVIHAYMTACMHTFILYMHTLDWKRDFIHTFRTAAVLELR